MDLAALTTYVPALSADWIILGGPALFLTLDAFRAGPSRAIALAICVPIALSLSTLIPKTAFIGALLSESSTTIQTGAFIALTLVLFIAMYRLMDTGADSLNMLQALIVGVASAIVCVCVLLQLPADASPWTFGEFFTNVFGEAHRLYWLVGAYFALAISRA